MRIASFITLLTLSGCNAMLDSPPGLTVEQAQHCAYVGRMHGNDGNGGVGPQSACIRYVRTTGRLPPPI